MKVTNILEMEQAYKDAFEGKCQWTREDMIDQIEDEIESRTLVKDLKVGETYQVVDNKENESEDIATFFYKLDKMHIDEKGCVCLDEVTFIEYQK